MITRELLLWFCCFCRTRDTRGKHARMNAVRLWNVTRALDYIVCLLCDSNFSSLLLKQSPNLLYKLQNNAKQTSVDCSAGYIPACYSTELLFGSGSVNGSVRFLSERSTLFGFRLTGNLLQGPSIAFFSITGQWETQINVRATLSVPRAVSSFTDIGTFLVSLGTFFSIRSAPPHGLI